jgi:hypothetical protein
VCLLRCRLGAVGRGRRQVSIAGVVSVDFHGTSADERECEDVVMLACFKRYINCRQGSGSRNLRNYVYFVLVSVKDLLPCVFNYVASE